MTGHSGESIAATRIVVPSFLMSVLLRLRCSLTWSLFCENLIQERVTLVSKNQLDSGASLASYVTSPICRKAAKERRKQVRRLMSSIVCGAAAVIAAKMSLVIKRRGFFERLYSLYDPQTILFKVSEVKTFVDYILSIWYKRRLVIYFSREAPFSLESRPRPSSR